MKAIRVFGLAVGLSALLAASSGCGGKSVVKDDKSADDAATAGNAAGDTATPAETTGEAAANPCAGGAMSMDEKKAVAEKVVAMFEKVATAIHDNVDDCTKMAAGVQKVADDHKELIATAKTMDDDPELKKWFDETHGEKMQATMGAAVGAMMQNCAEDEGVKRAFTNLLGT